MPISKHSFNLISMEVPQHILGWRFGHFVTMNFNVHLYSTTCEIWHLLGGHTAA
jgi:hypothetical protein